uniref:NADH dehydrogenase subunit 4 n=1 Tax=Anaka burmensis TaxID=2026963 RepID=UPI00255209D6|nr:NADH dehydrogenase subunit 4 [Anaka burmensis]UNZ99518.1 NADH dehydrogenase subunit 4 [Anaka burmensis]
MMKFMFYLLFMSLILNNNMWFTIQFLLLIILLIFMMNSINNYFSMISYMFGIDYFSYGLMILSILIVSMMIMSTTLKKFNKYFFLMNMMLLMILMTIFSSLNMFIMYMSFEFSLIPLMILIFGWGYQPERLISGLYLFFYTLFASLPLILVLIYFMVNYKTLFFDLKFGYSNSMIMHLSMMLAFLVKLPMFMLHFWLPKAHVQAPVSGSMILAGLLLKIGGYGLIRFMFIYENLFLKFNFIWFSFSISGSILVSMICLIQGDLKAMIAYSSIAHMGLCLMGILTMTNWGMFGAYMIMLSHGLCSSALFCLANISYERTNSRSFFLNKGLIMFMPSMTFMWFIFCSFNMSCPPSLNFISEIFIITSMIMYWMKSYLMLFFISFLSACFSFYLFSYSQHGSWNFLYSSSSGYTREFLMLIVHMIPLLIVILSLNSMYM